ncbi:MAG: ParB/RepB/Spo0J family partition protein [Neomegalonema sp.]|nr:ParB/RepB/Spo0J family partition protein [Neomegalonema sp.]
MQFIRSIEDINGIAFEDGIAAVEVPVELLPDLPLKNDFRGPSIRLQAVEASIRDKGFTPLEPIIARIGQKGRWIVVDGGHRLTAARSVSREFWTNLFGPKIRTLYFLLFETPRSWGKLKPSRKARERARLAVLNAREERFRPRPYDGGSAQTPPRHRHRASSGRFSRRAQRRE